ncbi:MAG: hypothetical protein AAF598_11055 [Bacteroidota bacterium]
MKYVICCCLFFFSVDVLCQDNAPLLIYTNASSGVQVKYDGITERFSTSDRLPLYGKLVLAKGEKANILYKEKKQKLEGPKTYQLDKLCAEMAKAEKKGFFGKFWAYLSNSVGNGSDSEELKKYDKVYSSSKAATKAYGEETGIFAPTYLTDIFGEEIVHFKWNSGTAYDWYHFTIYEEESDNFLADLQLNAPSCVVDLSTLNFEDGYLYYWQVTGYSEKDTTKMEPIGFYFDPVEIQSFKEKILQSAQVQELNPEELELYTLYELEDEYFLHQAYQGYANLIQAHPANALYKKLFAAYLVRMNALSEGLLQLEQIDP